MIRNLVEEHLARNVEFYGEEDGQRLFRKYAVQYLLLQTLSRDDRKKILKKQPAGEFLEVLQQVQNQMEMLG